MVSRIRVLSPDVVNQIAAGEVVERPASIIKELIENSMDAGASKIHCQVEAGGVKKIQVMDDGEGMSAEDLVVAVQSHATSKISSAEDLEHIGTYGFRGEALSSIAAVSRMKITSRRRKSPSGTELSVEGGRSCGVREMGFPEGTQVDVSDLFFNTPARRKFLRSTATEMGHIHSWITRFGLVRPGIHFRLLHGSKTVMDAPATEDPKQRLTALLGRDVYGHLYELRHEEEGIRVEGMLADPDITRSNSHDVYLYVNDRFVRDRLLQHALMQGVQTYLPGGRFPVAVLRLFLDASLVDVNVHPQKIEVRFLEGDRIHKAVTKAVQGLLSRAPWLDSLHPEQDGIQSQKMGFAHSRKDQVREALMRYRTSRSYEQGVKRDFAWSGPESAKECTFSDSRSVQIVLPSNGVQFLGSIWSTYLLFSEGEQFFVVDQHAAHERITYEKLCVSLDAGKVGCQRLLVPVQFVVTGEVAAALEEHREKLMELGIEADPFGENVIRVTAVPSLLVGTDVESLVRDVLSELSELPQSAAWESARIEMLSKMACHASVRGGRALSETEAVSLFLELERMECGDRCPHGRPVLKEFSRTEVERWFQRG
jgi:DNA mismatch repair protein MutL